MRAPTCAVLAILPFALACAGASPTGRGGQVGRQEPVAAPQKPVGIGFAEEPALLESAFGTGGRSREYAALLSAFLAYLTPEQQPVPYLAEELPSFEKGTWAVLPDGRAETTYRLNRRAAWHDGQPGGCVYVEILGVALAIVMWARHIGDLCHQGLLLSRFRAQHRRALHARCYSSLDRFMDATDQLGSHPGGPRCAGTSRL